MVDQTGDPVAPAEDRDDAMRDQEGDQRDRRGSERRARRRRAPADDRAYCDGDREIEGAELGKRAPFPQTQAEDGYREEQDSLNRHPSKTARAPDQFRHMRHKPYSSSSLSQNSLAVGNAGTACHSCSSGTWAVTAMVAAYR